MPEKPRAAQAIMCLEVIFGTEDEGKSLQGQVQSNLSLADPGHIFLHVILRSRVTNTTFIADAYIGVAHN